MSERTIANFLKQLRKTSGHSANEVVEMLQTYSINISIKTLYGYESGLSMPNADVFVALCRIYKCDNPLDIFETPSVTQNELSIIEKYRELDERGKEMVDSVLEQAYNSRPITAYGQIGIFPEDGYYKIWNGECWENYAKIKMENTLLENETDISPQNSTILNSNDKLSKPELSHTIAAHFDGDELTDEETAEIKEFEKFAKNRKR